MADFTSREADERDTKLRDAARQAGHHFEVGGQMCLRCQVGLLYLRTEASAAGVFPCPGKKNRPAQREHSGNKYHRVIHELAAYKADPGAESSVTVDVYSVLTAFPTGHPGCDHAVKKILCAGIRGKGSRLQDLREARDALTRAIEDAEREAEFSEN